MPKKIDLTGKVFERLTVLAENPIRSNDGKVKWDCICICGNTLTTSGGNLRTGDTRSCGCLEYDMLVLRNLKHGKSKTSEYTIWKGVIRRCYNKNDTFYHYYGGRGIAVCDSWRNSFESFLKDMGERPTITHSIDRRDNNGNYEPENCYWATKKQQGSNKRNNRVISHNNRSMILQDWADHFKIPVSTLHSSLKVNSFDVVFNKYTIW